MEGMVERRKEGRSKKRINRVIEQRNIERRKEWIK